VKTVISFGNMYAKAIYRDVHNCLREFFLDFGFLIKPLIMLPESRDNYVHATMLLLTIFHSDSLKDHHYPAS
jgi:hypothetical protein